MSETTKPVALITGGGRGMGEAIARELGAGLSAGADVAVRKL